VVWAALAALVLGCTNPQGEKPPIHGPRPPHAPVPPTQEIEVLDPNVDATGKPVPVLRPGYGGFQQVDVPPAVLVHRYYYTGDRSFQAQMLPGGPVIVTVNHPRSMERVYVPVTLPPGAPRVSYREDCIRYDYGPQSVILSFGLCGNPKVLYTQATAAGEQARATARHVKTSTHAWAERTGVPNALRQLRATAKSAAGATADRINDVGQLIVTPLSNAAQAFPGAQLLQSTPEDQAVRAQERLQRAADLNPNIDNTFVPRVP
jgi:hypothetical protein